MGLAALAAATMPAGAHPHIFADARLEVTVGPDNTVGALRHVWRFDEIWSSGEVLLTFDANQDLVLDDAELETAAETFHASLADFDYFQFMTQDGKAVELERPERLMVTFEDGQMMILFESRPKTPVELSGTIDFGVYDPTYYIALDFEDDNLAALDMPDFCLRSVMRPDLDEVLAQGALTEAFFDEPGVVDVGKSFATRLELTCNPKEKPS